MYERTNKHENGGSYKTIVSIKAKIRKGIIYHWVDNSFYLIWYHVHVLLPCYTDMYKLNLPFTLFFYTQKQNNLLLVCGEIMNYYVLLYLQNALQLNLQQSTIHCTLIHCLRVPKQFCE